MDTEVAAAEVGLLDYKGAYNASTNAPDLDTDPSTVKKGDVYTVTVAGDFFTLAVEVGDVLIAEQDDPDAVGDWTTLSKDLDAASIKTLYETNADTNAYDDAEQAKLAALAVTASSVTDGTTTFDKYVHPNHSGDVTSTADGATVIAADAVTGAKIAADAIDSEHYTNASIDNAHIAADAVTGAKIADDAIDSEHYTNGSIDAAHLSTNCVSSAKIVDNAITLAKLEDGTQGDVLYYGASGAPARLAKGTAGQHLTMNSGATAPEWTSLSSGSPFDFITRVVLASGADPAADVAATSINISSYVSSSASTLGVTPTVAIVELYADITTSVTRDAELLLKVGDDSSMSHYAYVRAHNVHGSRDDAANTASPTNQAFVPIGGTAGSEVLYYSVDLIDQLGIDRNYKVELVGFCK